MCMCITRSAPRFSRSWSVFETPRSTELTPSLRKHHAEWEISECYCRQALFFIKNMETFECTGRSMTVWCISYKNGKHFLSLACFNITQLILHNSALISGWFLARISLKVNQTICTNSQKCGWAEKHSPMASWAAVQPSLSATRWSSLIFASCLRPSSLYTRSFSHW